MGSSQRQTKKPIIWEGDLNDDCSAHWEGLLLRAELMDEDYWWWCVYDMENNEEQIDSSNEYEIRVLGGAMAREEAELAAVNYLKRRSVTD